MAEPDDEFDRPFHHPERDLDRLRRIIRYQRWMIAVVLAQLVLWFGFIVLTTLRHDMGREPIRFPIFLTLILNGVGALFVFLMLLELRGAFSAVTLALAALFPCVGLLVITMVNSYATTELKRNGVNVGLFGASLADLEDRPSLYDDEDAGW
jgi:hypothetical protein